VKGSARAIAPCYSIIAHILWDKGFGGSEALRYSEIRYTGCTQARSLALTGFRLSWCQVIQYQVRAEIIRPCTRNGHHLRSHLQRKPARMVDMGLQSHSVEASDPDKALIAVHREYIFDNRIRNVFEICRAL
jgi:hypothetical protein